LRKERLFVIKEYLLAMVEIGISILQPEFKTYEAPQNTLTIID